MIIITFIEIMRMSGNTFIEMGICRNAIWNQGVNDFVDGNMFCW